MEFPGAITAAAPAIQTFEFARDAEPVLHALARGKREMLVDGTLAGVDSRAMCARLFLLSCVP